MYRVEYSVSTNRVRLVCESGEYIAHGKWTDNVSYLRDWRDSSADNPELQEALNEALTILGTYDSKGVRTRISNRGVSGMGNRVVDLHYLRDGPDVASPRDDF